MKLIIMRHGKVVSEVNGKKVAALSLGWTEDQVSEAIRTGQVFDNVTIDYAITRKRGGDAVIAYTSTTAYRFPSLSECARSYGISRTRLIRLLESGGTAEDGITTFDIPCD